MGAVVVILIVLVVLVTVPFQKASGSGTVALQGSPSNVNEGVGWAVVNISSPGSVHIGWQVSTSGPLGGIVVVAGQCTTLQACATSIQAGYICVSPVYGNGSASGSCTFTIGASGTYTIVGIETSGFVAGNDLTYSYTVDGPLLTL